MRLSLLVTLLSVAGICHAQDDWMEKTTKDITLHFTKSDENTVTTIEKYLLQGEETVVSFFKHPFPRKFDVYIFPNRAALDKQWQQDWGAPDFKSECWMVASGVGHRLDLLSPNTWATEACEHQASKTDDVQKLITHELVHVYQGQHNPKPTFDGLDDLAWLIEGVAVFASGQLSDTRLEQVKRNIQAGKAPTQLAQFWTGQAKYGQAGSLVSYVDKTIGREALFNLLSATNQAVILEGLKKTETQLIDDWKKSVDY